MIRCYHFLFTKISLSIILPKMHCDGFLFQDRKLLSKVKQTIFIRREQQIRLSCWCCQARFTMEYMSNKFYVIVLNQCNRSRFCGSGEFCNFQYGPIGFCKSCGEIEESKVKCEGAGFETKRGKEECKEACEGWYQ